MSGPGSSQPPERVPTLTEVVAWPEVSTVPQALPATQIEGDLPQHEADMAPNAERRAVPRTAAIEDALARRVLADVQRQVDLMLDYRLREVLTPLLNRAADTIVREARAELASTLRELVARAVADELARQRTR